MNDESKTTLDCTDIKAMLSPLIDGELADADRHRAERHLAECAACRDLISETERTEAIVAAVVELNTGLPDGFEEAVLLRTVVAHRSRARRFRATLGWLAVAAAVMLTLSLWVIVRGGWIAERPGLIVATDPPRAMFASRIIPNEVPVYPLENAAVPAHDPMVGEAMAPTDESSTPAPDAPGGIPRDSAETFEAASLLLAMIQRSDADNFTDVEQVRRITEYEDLLTRLAEARLLLPAEDQPAVFAAESMLYRIVRGPLSLDEVRELRNTIDRLDLSGQMDAISGRWPAASSL